MKTDDSSPSEEFQNSFIPEDSIIGIGVVTFNDTNHIARTKHFLYDENGKLLCSISLSDDDVETVFGNKLYHRHDSMPIRPRYFIPNPYYFSLYFDCIAKNDSIYSIIIDRKSQLLGKVRIENGFKFESIEEYIKSEGAIAIDFNWVLNPLRKAPADNSEIIHIESGDITYSGEQLKLKGDWMEILIGEKQKGWIRWRFGNQILVQLSHGC